MQINLTRQSGVPLVRQIYQEISERIRFGSLEEGTPLPSIRSLSRQCDVSFMTVVEAYRLLEEAGLIERIQGRGTFVGKAKNEVGDTGQPNKVSCYEWQHAVADYLPRAQVWQSMQAEPENGFSFSITSLHPELVPLAELTSAVQNALRDDPTVLFKYGPVQGDGLFRKAYAEYAKNFRLNLHPEELIVTNGAQQGIDQVARSFIGPGDVVVTEVPTYSAAIDVFRARGATVLSVPVDEEGMRVDLLASLCDQYPPKLIYTMPTYQNPTGALMSQRRRTQLLDLAQSYRSIILEDDLWSEIYFGKAPPPPIKSMDEHGHVIYLKSFSKILAPGCRVAVLAANGRFLNRLMVAKAAADWGSPLLTQRAILSFMQSFSMEKHVKQLRQRLLGRRDLALSVLEQHAPAGVRWTVPQGGCNIWITLPPWLRAEELVVPASREKINFLPGWVCYPGEPEFHHLRICFSSMSEDELRQGMLGLCRIFQESIEAPLEKPPVV
ncbi:PLP-dependent aminotransferase family protein [Brevibacillus sp. B_LB10_24]|uniref:MocR-like pyridoxine biosynthesis transcription factor PdxR n=1 Tax=Brevibacillus sp. B_LB10_24 TaxID=3380645 RepID=UPI0038B71C5A